MSDDVATNDKTCKDMAIFGSIHILNKFLLNIWSFWFRIVEKYLISIHDLILM